MTHKNHSSVILISTLAAYHKVTEKSVCVILKIVESFFCINRSRDTVVVVLYKFVYGRCHFLSKTINTVNRIVERCFEVCSLKAATFVHNLYIGNCFFRVFGCAVADIYSKLTRAFIEVVFKQAVIFGKLTLGFINTVSINQFYIPDITFTDIVGSVKCRSYCLT